MEEGARNVTLHHNLFAHNDDGNPRLQGATKVDFLSNIVYDWGLVAAGVHLSRAVEMNLANSYFRRGPDSIGSFFLPLDAPPVDPPSSIWIAANRGNDDNLYRYNSDPAPFQAAYPFLSGAPPFPASAAVDEADWAFELVLGRAGATVPKRDAVDMRLAGEARRRTGRLIDSPADVGGWPVYRPAPPPADADRDGMPDEWEAGCGLDPADPADAAEDADGDGYTALEAFLNGKGGDR